MKRLTLLCCLLTLSGAECPQEFEFEIVGLPAAVKEGDVVPPLSIPYVSTDVTLVCRAPDLKVPDLPLNGTVKKVLVDDGSVTFDDISFPSTGVFALRGKVGDSKAGDAKSGQVEVTTRHFAEVTCQEDGSVIGAASTQTPLPQIIGEGSCKLTRGGGDPVPANFGTVRCDFLGVSASCTAPNGNCFNRGPMVRIPFGTSVSASWSGGTVPAGSATAVRPEAIDAGLPPMIQARSQPLRISFQGTGEGTVRLTVVQQASSTVAIDCLVPVSAGVVEAPSSLLQLLERGRADVILTVDGRMKMPSDDFATTLVVPGPIPNGYLTAVPITLE